MDDGQRDADVVARARVYVWVLVWTRAWVLVWIQAPVDVPARQTHSHLLLLVVAAPVPVLAVEAPPWALALPVVEAAMLAVVEAAQTSADAPRDPVAAGLCRLDNIGSTGPTDP